MATIPQIREDLIAIGDELIRAGMQSHVTIQNDAEKLGALIQQSGLKVIQLAQATRRRSAVRRARVRHPPLSEEQKGFIRRYAADNPHMHQQDIAVEFNTNAGRVSEALAGKRE